MKILVLTLTTFALWAPNASAATCKAGGLPDAKCSPGVVLASADSDAEARSLCPKAKSLVVSARTKRKVFTRYGISKRKQARYVIDPVIPFELGGTNTPANLFPQTLAMQRKKNKLEATLHQSVCNLEIGLTGAQSLIATDWLAAYRKFFP